MLKSFKNFTSLRTFLKTVFLFSFLLLGLLFPLSPAHAQVGEFFSFLGGGIAEAIGNWIGKMIVYFIAAILAGLVTPAAAFLSWSIDPIFIRVSYTHGGIIEVGWTVVRDLANMGIVLALVIIGLATALRLEEYQARRTLPLLIIIALLINFTPVILGVIVDGSNIVMNFFLAGLTGGKIILGQFQNLFSTFSAGLGGLNVFELDSLVSFAIKLIIMIIFAFFIFIIFVLYAFLFIMRRVAIWILVILSPLAFVAYVLPATRGFWNFWWRQFWQWTIIGIFAAFFLWLGDHMIGLAGRSGEWPDQVAANTPILGTGAASMLNDIMPILVALIFLLIGFFVALSTSAMGATGIVAGAQGLARRLPAMAAESKVGRKVLGGGAERIAKGLEAAAKGTKGLEERAGKISGVGGVAAKAAAKPLALATWATRAAAAPALLRYAAKARRVPIPREFDEMSIDEQQRYTESIPWAEDRVSLASRMKEKGTLQKAGTAFQERMIEEAKGLAESPYYKKEVANLMDALPDKITAKMKIDFEITPEAKDEMRRKIEDTVKELGISEDEAAAVVHIRGLKPGEIPDVAKSSLKTKVFRLGTHGFSSSHLQRLRDSFDRETVEGVYTGEGGLQTIIKSREDLENFYAKNPRLVNWFATSPAGREWNFKGLEFMRDVGGRRTERFADFTEKQRVFSQFDEIAPNLRYLVNRRNLLQERIEETQSKTQSLQLDLSLAQAAGQPTASLQSQITDLQNRLARNQTHLTRRETEIANVTRKAARDPKKAARLEEIREIERRRRITIL